MKIGDHVVLTKEAQRSFGSLRSKTGVVKRISQLNPVYIQVQRDGVKRIESWHRKFWRVCNRKAKR